jgi:hypothetical protein
MKFLLVALSLVIPLVAQERVDQSTDAKMRSEELEHSQIMHTLHMLTDRYGPRVTGTPNHELAAKWAAAQMTQWGMKNAHLEPWEFGHPGWLNESASGHISAPVRENILKCSHGRPLLLAKSWRRRSRSSRRKVPCRHPIRQRLEDAAVLDAAGHPRALAR